MYFMNICTWKPEDEKEVEKRRAKWKWPKGVKVICEFVDLQGCRVHQCRRHGYRWIDSQQRIVDRPCVC